MTTKRPQITTDYPSGHGSKPAARREAAILELLSAPNHDQAAAAAGVSAATLKNWLKEPSFRERLTEARREAFSESLNRLKDTAGKAVAVLRDLLEDESSAVRLRAAVAVLDGSRQAHEVQEIEARLAALEAGLQEGSIHRA